MIPISPTGLYTRDGGAIVPVPLDRLIAAALTDPVILAGGVGLLILRPEEPRPFDFYGGPRADIRRMAGPHAGALDAVPSGGILVLFPDGRREVRGPLAN